MQRFFTFLMVLLLVGFGVLVGQVIHEKAPIAACEQCYRQCYDTYVETRTYDETEFLWTDCQDYCRGLKQCEASFARDYVEWKLKVLRWLGWDIESDSVRVPNHVGNTSENIEKGKVKASVVTPLKRIQNKSPQKGVVPPQERKRTWKEAQSYCAAKGGRLPSREEMVQHLLLLPKVKRTGAKFWAQGPLYPDGNPPVVSMTSDSFGVVPASPQAYHHVFCF